MVWRIGPVNEEKVVVRNVVFLKRSLVVLFLVKSYHSSYVHVSENVAILARMMAVPVPFVPLLNRAHEGNKLVWNDPIKITVLDLLIKLVFFHIEGLEIVPAKPNSVLKAL